MRKNIKIAVYQGKKTSEHDARLEEFYKKLQAGGYSFYNVLQSSDIEDNTEFLLSVGGDGTFLSAAALVASSGIPVLGLNLGRLGFLSENRLEDVLVALLERNYIIEQRSLLQFSITSPSGIGSNQTGNDSDSLQEMLFPYALNEVTVHRSGAAMLGVDILVNGKPLPTYWADGIVLSTSSGSTAYSLSVGGPIVLPESKVLIISPIAPHNLNVRPMVVPDTSKIELTMLSRDEKYILTTDNRTMEMPSDAKISVELAPFALKKIRLNNSDFINALTEKLFWGEDVRNHKK